MKKVFTFATILTVFLPLSLFAAESVNYRPLVGIPGVTDANDFNGYINSLYVLSITIAALLAVIKIIIAGVKWMMTDVVTSKSDAKKDIQGALIGLLIVLSAVLILTIVNPETANVNLTFDHLSKKTYTGTAASKPTLDTSKVSTVNSSLPGATVKFMDSSAGGEQQLLFANSCPNNANQRFSSGPKGSTCLQTPATKALYPYPTSAAAAAQSYCTQNNGNYYADPNEGMVYCMVDK